MTLYLRVTSTSVQDLFLTLHSGIPSGRLGGPYGVPGIELGSVACETNALPTVLPL